MADQKLLEALRLLAENPGLVDRLLEAGSPKPGKVPTIGELWDEWAVWGEANISSWRISANSGRVIPRTKFHWQGREVTLFDLPWPEMTPEVCELYRAARVKMPNGRGGTISPPTIDRELSNVQMMLSYFHELLRRIPHNPIAGWRRCDAEEYARKTSLTPDKIREFIECGHPIFQDVVWVGYRCAGMRPSESRMLKKSEIDWDLKTINLSQKRNKNRRPRVIPFPDDVAEILERHCKTSLGPYAFVKPWDPKRVAPLSDRWMHWQLKLCRDRSKLKGFDGEAIVLHTLQRHSGVTQLVTDGAPESHIRRAAAMSDKTFQRYSQFNRPQQESLRAIMNRKPEPPTPLVSMPTGERVDAKHAEGAPAAKPAARHDRDRVR